jgi:hypothetical protein
MTPKNLAWQNLVTAARRARDDRDASAPYGFSTRVAALAMSAQELSIGSIFERFSWRALGLASLLAITSIAAGYAWQAAPTDEDLLTDDTMVAALFDTSGT